MALEKLFGLTGPTAFSSSDRLRDSWGQMVRSTATDIKRVQAVSGSKASRGQSVFFLLHISTSLTIERCVILTVLPRFPNGKGFNHDHGCHEPVPCVDTFEV